LSDNFLANTRLGYQSERVIAASGAQRFPNKSLQPVIEGEGGVLPGSNRLYAVAESLPLPGSATAEAEVAMPYAAGASLHTLSGLNVGQATVGQSWLFMRGTVTHTAHNKFTFVGAAKLYDRLDWNTGESGSRGLAGEAKVWAAYIVLGPTWMDVESPWSPVEMHFNKSGVVTYLDFRGFQ
jgi:hypothetical protein